MNTVNKLKTALPEFEAIVDFARQQIGEKHAIPLQNDLQNLRNRAPIYIQEYHDYDMQKFEFMERFKRNLEQSGLLSLEQIKDVMQVCFPKTPKPENWREPVEHTSVERIEAPPQETKSEEIE